jgi:sugar phosphate isomerase/epimerase
MLNFGFSTYFFVKKEIHRLIDDIVSSGLRTIEVSYEIPHVRNMDNTFKSRVNSLRTIGIEFSMHAPFLEINLGSFFQDNRARSMGKLKSALDMAHEIGCDPIVVHPGYTSLAGRIKGVEDVTRGYFIEDLAELSGYAKDRGLRIALENVHMPIFFFSELSEFQALHREIPTIGVTLDLGHAYITKRSNGEEDPEEAIIQDIERTGVENLFHVHAHNNWGARDDHLFLSGDMDLKRILRALDSLQYKGKVIIESYEAEGAGMPEVLAKLNEILPQD